MGKKTKYNTSKCKILIEAYELKVMKVCMINILKKRLIVLI